MRRALRILRNLVLLLIVAAVVLAAVLVANTWRKPTRQIAVAPVASAAVDDNAAALRLGAAVRLQTIASATDADQSAEAFRALHGLIAQNYPAFHAAAKREVVANYSLLYTWEGSDPKAQPIALLAHQDVVPIAPGTEGDWQVPPFSGEVKDGFIWGRGSWDDKGNLFSMLEAAEQLAKEGFKPKRTIYFAFGHDEEVSGKRGAAAMSKLLQSRGVKLGFAFDEGLLITDGILKGVGKPVALIGVAEKGYVTLSLSTTATPGHSSLPPPDTAIGKLSVALARLEKRPFPASVSGVMRETLQTVAPEMDFSSQLVLSNLWLFEPLVRAQLLKTAQTAATIRTTTALTIFNAGNKENVLPGRAEAIVNFRLLPGETEESVIARVKSLVGDDRIKVTPLPGNTNPPPMTSTATPDYQMVNRTIREIFPDVLVAPGLMVAATDSRNYLDVTGNIFRFSPVRATAEDLKRFHGTNERLSVANYADMIRFYRRLVQNAAAP
ncbi:M20/M25/M40 family peptidase [Bradyrhizobiaceae bacterium SG-6C]|nr:M20/M25/M40 family peptidase [Bradyrhizobiaceae bacterium SG-6C]